MNPLEMTTEQLVNEVLTLRAARQVTAPVAGGGVLSVMNCAVIALDDYSMESKRQPSPTAASLRAAIQAVAELIAADKEYDEAEADLDDAIKSGGWSGETTLRCRDRVRDIRNRRAAALSNIEGGKA